MLDSKVKIIGRFQANKCKVRFENGTFFVTDIPGIIDSKKKFFHTLSTVLLANSSILLHSQKEETIFAERCIEVFELYGPLFSKKEFTIHEVRTWVTFFVAFMIVYNKSTHLEVTRVPNVRFIEHVILKPLAIAIKRFPKHNGYWEISGWFDDRFESDLVRFPVLPATKAPHGFIIPNRGPKENSRDSIIEWAKKELIPLNLNHVFSAGMRYEPSFSSDGQLTILARPSDKLTAAILEVLEDSMNSIEQREIDAMKQIEHELREARRNIIARCRTWSNRPTSTNHITKQDLENIKQYSLFLIEEQQVGSRKEMIMELRKRFKWFR